MRNIAKNLLTLLALSFLVVGCVGEKEVQREYFVKRVIDGDTIELEDGRFVRYIGIDTPEVRKMIDGKWVYNPQPYALEAKEFNRSLVENKYVRLEFDVEKKDRYRRLLAYVHEGQNFINLEMLKAGYAMLYTLPPNVRHVEEFIIAQREARENKRGFWADLEREIISYKEAKDFIGRFKMVEGKVRSVYSSEKVSILKFGRADKNSFKVVIFKNSLSLFFKKGIVSLKEHYKGKLIRVYGLIKEYKGAPEIIVNDLSQIEFKEKEL